jgi:hypothetical protein
MSVDTLRWCLYPQIIMLAIANMGEEFFAGRNESGVAKKVTGVT